MRHIICVSIIAWACVGLSTLFGFSESSGLFGAIIGCCSYAANVKGDAS